MKNKTEKLIRLDDRELFSINKDGTYSRDSDKKRPKYTYSYEKLMSTGIFDVYNEEK